jgi:hypothetical protein
MREEGCIFNLLAAIIMTNLLYPYNFIFELPLYTEIEITDENRSEFFKLMHFSGKIDGYNPILKQETTYQVSPPFRYSEQKSFIENYVGFKEFQVSCVRNNYWIKIFVVLLSFENENEEEDVETVYKFLKVGQFPSIADLHISKVRNYDKVLDRNKIKEFTRAIGLAANGVGIGSFIYLRRIFEHLIGEAYSLASKNDNWDDLKFTQSRMAEKIEILKNYLPKFLVDNKNMYSILSLAVHELTEQECLKYFEALKIGIELILDEKIEKQAKAKRLIEAQQKLQAIEQQIKK